MQIQTLSRSVQTSTLNPANVSRARIQASEKIFNFFSTQTYSDIYSAVVREIIANAVDSHNAAGKSDVPIEVWAPTMLEPSFRVKDTGIGMSHEFIQNQYLTYADGSTKDDSNDQIGGFGIGKAAALALTDQFSLRCVHDGTLCLYSVYKDDEGIPTVALLHSEETDEENGVEVSVPIETKYIYKIEGAMTRVIPYFEPMPISHGLEIEPVEYVIEGETWGLPRAGGSDTDVIMGGIRYPVSTHQVEINDDMRWMGVDLKLPIGSCSIQLSREALIYDDKTKKALTAALKGVYAEIKILAKDMLSNETTLWNAMTKLAEIGRSNGRLGNIVRKEARFNGKEVSTFFEPVDKVPFAWIKSRNRRGTAHGKCPNFTFTSGSFEVGRAACIIVNDLYGDTKARSTARIKQYVEDNLAMNDQALVIQKLEDLPKFGDPSPDQYVLVSTMPLPPVKPRVKYDRPKIRAFRLPKDSYQSPGYGETWRKYLRELDSWEIPESGVVSVMDNFSIDGQLLKAVRDGIFNTEEVILVNKSDASKLKGSGFRPAPKAYKTRIDALLSQYEDLGVYRTLCEHSSPNLHRIFSMFSSPSTAGLFEGYETKRKPLAKLYRMYLKYYLPNKDAQAFLLSSVDAKPVPRIDPQTLIDDYLKTQPEVEALRDALSYVRNDENTKTLINLLKEKM